MTAAEAISYYGGVRPAARALGVDPKTLRTRRAKEAQKVATAKAAAIKAPKLTKKEEPIERVIRRLAENAKRDKLNADAAKWARVHVADTKPIGIVWFGDPHLGANTDWALLERDVALCASTPGCYGANIGDTTNNWAGSLIRKYADDDISRKTERRLARWFLAETGIVWLCWIMGNHDEWSDGAEILRLMNVHQRVTMLDWVARLELCFPGRQRVRVHAAHDFPGHSMWNATHGPSRAAQLTSDADLYVCGHRHHWGVQQFEMPERGRSPLMVRAAGYKRHDEYARRLGFAECQHGAAVLTIIDPTRKGPGRVLAFADVEQGCKVLTALRG